MANSAARRVRPAKLRKDIREWLANETIPNVRAIARDLENAGEDVTDLIEAIDELEALVHEGPGRPVPRIPVKSET